LASAKIIAIQRGHRAGLVQLGELSTRLFIHFLAIIIFGIFVESCGQKSVFVNAPNNLAQTPPMGWNSWDTFMSGISDKLLRQVADAMVTNGMRDAGYQYINIDDGWALPNRVNGHLEPDPAKFPGGFKPVTDYLHARGFKFGIYSDRGTKTCVSGAPGSYGHETIDANDFAAWGVDYLKYDNCNPAFLTSQEGDYRRMQEALMATGKPFVFSICAWEFKKWMPSIGNLWRTTDDITDNWNTIINNIDKNEKSANYAGPGRWNDPDMLVVGCFNVQDLQHNHLFDGNTDLVGNKGLTDDENIAHFSMWAMMAAPLIASNDVIRMPEKIREILTNQEVIAVDQDPLGIQGIKVWENGKGLFVYSKVLKGHDTRAIALFNRSESNAEIMAKWIDANIPDGKATVRDLWKHEDMGMFTNGYKAYVPSHGIVLLKVVSVID
jgi:alpha-galactosidase